MAGDDLHKPLGLERKAKRRRAPFVRLFGPFLLAGLALAGFVVLRGRGDPSSEPQAVAAILPEQPASAAAAGAPAAKPVVAHGAIENAAEIEQQSGVKVVRADGGTAPESMIIEVPQALGITLTPAPDRRLVENSRYGLLPRIGPDGARPADVYARPVVTNTANASAPRIALVIGGLGLSPALTERAIADLPGAVTFAFAPYGRDLNAIVARARAQGHEAILQLPMEPIDYPQTNPGPHLLLTTASAAENTDNLHWLLSRFTGYTGVANFLGAKLTADADAFSPILREIAARGLIYADDGSSPQSLAPALAAQVNLPVAQADIILDATPDGIDSALVKLEAIARDKGLAIGMASALPASLEKIGRFARAAESHGLVLIPLSAAVGKSAPGIVDRGQ